MIRRILRAAQNRRQFLGRSALAAGGLALGGGLLAACGRKGAEAPAAGAAAAPQIAKKTLRISNWPLYIDEKTVPDFTAATGIPVEYSEDVNDNNEFFAKIDEPLKRGQSIDRDIVVLTDWMVGPDDRARLLRAARPGEVPQPGQPGRRPARRQLRSGAQVQRAVDVGHGRHRLQPEEDRPRAHQRRGHLRPEVQGPGDDAHRDARHARPGHARPRYRPGEGDARGRPEGLREGQEGPRERAGARVHRQRLRRRPGRRQHRDRDLLVGRHPGPGRRQPRPASGSRPRRAR